MGVVSVLDLSFGECSFCSFSLLLSERELVRLVLLVALICNANIYVFCGVLMFYLKVVANGMTGFTGCTLILLQLLQLVLLVILIYKVLTL